MVAIDSLHHESPTTLAGVKPAALVKASDKATKPPSRRKIIPLLLLLLMPLDRQRPDRSPRNSSWQRAK
ncbi:hypothetical protein TNCV_4468311 [Trichonephila clavipes]|nr:hypothetical protein TNCV_4468311 [Trichonephila clavipes]